MTAKYGATMSDLHIAVDHGDLIELEMKDMVPSWAIGDTVQEDEEDDKKRERLYKKDSLVALLILLLLC